MHPCNVRLVLPAIALHHAAGVATVDATHERCLGNGAVTTADTDAMVSISSAVRAKEVENDDGSDALPGKKDGHDVVT